MSSSPPYPAPPASAGPDLRDRAEELAATAREQWQDRTRAIQEFVVQRPVGALGLALAMGVVLGWLIKRR